LKAQSRHERVTDNQVFSIRQGLDRSDLVRESDTDIESRIERSSEVQSRGSDARDSVEGCKASDGDYLSVGLNC
jgi:hypothetical protein